MIFIVGERLYGKVDYVPDLFAVKTRFMHVFWFPIIPLHSHLVLSRSPQSFPVPWRWKSVLLAWFRAWSIAFALWFVIFVLLALLGKMPGEGLNWIVALGLAVTCFSLFVVSLFFSRASPRRALTLAGLAGIDPERVARRFPHYPNMPSLIEEFKHGQEETLHR